MKIKISLCGVAIRSSSNLENLEKNSCIVSSLWLSVGRLLEVATVYFQTWWLDQVPEKLMI